MMEEIYVDGCNNKTIGACSTVTDKYGNDLIGPYSEFLTRFEFLKHFDKKEYNNRVLYEVNFTDVITQQNNGAELLAMVIGLCIAIYYDVKTIYSDSTLIIEYWSTKLSTKINCPLKRQLQYFCVQIATKFRNKGGQIKHISGAKNPADPGFHR